MRTYNREMGRREERVGRVKDENEREGNKGGRSEHRGWVASDARKCMKTEGEKKEIRVGMRQKKF